MSAENHVEIDAPAEAVFAVLADPRTYPDWVVGCDRIRAIDAEWPQPGSRFHHTVGAGPVKVDDSTSVVRIEPPSLLTLEARAGAAGTTFVTFMLERVQSDGRAHTRVTIEEQPVDGAAAHVPGAVADAGLELRNGETLRRLRKLVEGDARS